ncbi:hypothetical protein [Caldimonas sp. KR1-144]|uniref:hypothetical protein n=1 Tax=Caldimonas sp. KR1-144 TaxID=3400911 RepID=UPI003C06A62A
MKPLTKHGWLETLLSGALAVWWVLLLSPLGLERPENAQAIAAQPASPRTPEAAYPSPQVDPHAAPEALPPTF